MGTTIKFGTSGWRAIVADEFVSICRYREHVSVS